MLHTKERTLTRGRRTLTTMAENPQVERIRSNEGQHLRTPVMGLRAEARRISYIKNKRLRRSQSSCSRRSIHRKKSWFRVRKPHASQRFSDVSRREEKSRKTGTQWARIIINRLSFNKLFKEQPS
ncbi:hypothetical protein RB195_015835 [Necator americanus]|uniref:Uncharacterized protein n=1 Tax=Necator americanus TaxID=51031 RepID=A0ABR1E6C3_NECAM